MCLTIELGVCRAPNFAKSRVPRRNRGDRSGRTGSRWCPTMTGSFCGAILPSTWSSSVLHTPQAMTCISTSRGPGRGIGTSRRTKKRSLPDMGLRAPDGRSNTIALRHLAHLSEDLRDRGRRLMLTVPGGNAAFFRSIVRSEGESTQ